MEAKQIKSLIDQAFAAVERPPERSVAANSSNLETSTITKNYAGKNRSEIEGTSQYLDVEALAAMSEDGIHYYLPAFLKRIVEDPALCETPLSLALISFLDLSRSRQYYRYPKFSEQQKAAIVQVLMFVKENIKLYGLSELERTTSGDLERIVREWQDNK